MWIISAGARRCGRRLKMAGSHWPQAREHLIDGGVLAGRLDW